MGVMAKSQIHMEVNGKRVSVEVEPQELLVDVLRERLGLTGTKVGCREGECGACSVLFDGRVVPSCLIPAMKTDGREITTIEGLEQNGELHPLQREFLNRGAVQCGFCTPGMLLSAKNLLDENPKPTLQQIREAISGVLCRCTGYQKIIQAIQAVSETMEGKKV